MRCLRHALRTTPSPDWWRRVLLSAPCYRPHTQQASTPGAVFSPEMIGEAVADRTIELLKMTNTGTTMHFPICFLSVFVSLVHCMTG